VVVLGCFDVGSGSFRWLRLWSALSCARLILGGFEVVSGCLVCFWGCFVLSWDALCRYGMSCVVFREAWGCFGISCVGLECLVVSDGMLWVVLESLVCFLLACLVYVLVYVLHVLSFLCSADSFSPGAGNISST
jgi:hypothetical protein